MLEGLADEEALPGGGGAGDEGRGGVTSGGGLAGWRALPAVGAGVFGAAGALGGLLCGSGVVLDAVVAVAAVACAA